MILAVWGWPETLLLVGALVVFFHNLREMGRGDQGEHRARIAEDRLRRLTEAASDESPKEQSREPQA